MRRRAVQLGSVAVAVAALALVLYNATLVDRRPPSITRIALSAPTSDPKVGQTLTAIDVDFSEPVRTTTVEQRFHIAPFVAGTFTWDGSAMIWTPSQKLPADTAFTVTIEPGFEDLAGNAASTGLDPWAFRTAGPPTVTAVEPAAGATDVPVTTAVRVTFDRLMDTASVERAITVAPDAAWHATWSGQTVTLTLDAPLAFGTQYTVTVGTDARDTGGSPLRAPYVATFTTVTAGLGVASTLPVDNVSGVSVRTPIAVVFDGPIDPASITGALRITPTVGGSVTVTSLPDDRTPVAPAASASASPTSGGGGNVLLFTPGSPLAPHTTYTLTLAAVVRGTQPAAGVAAGRSWSFTTGGPTTSAQNQIAFISDRGGVRNVWLMNPDGSNQRQVTDELVPVTTFDVAATGDRIVYAAGGVVRDAAIDGSDVRTITTNGRFEYSPIFGPESRSVYLGRRGPDGADLGWWQVPVQAGAGSERQVLAAGAPPLGSVASTKEVAGPDAAAWGRKAAVSDDARRLLVVDASGTPILADLVGNPPLDPQTVAIARVTSAPAWDRSADGFVVVGVGPGGAVSEVWRIAPAGEPMTVVPGTIAASTSSDGGLVTIGAGQANGHLEYVPPRSTAPTVLTTASDLLDRQPSFSPDGASILFFRVRASDPRTSAGIWVVDPDGRELRQLSVDGSDPRWLP